MLLRLIAAALIGAPGASGPVQAPEDSTLASLCRSGLEQLDSQDLYAAYGTFRRALRMDADHPEALYGMGRVMLNARSGGQRAVEYLRRAVQQAPEDTRYRYYKALAHMRMARSDVGKDNTVLALQELESVIERDPSHPDAYYRRGVLYREGLEDHGRAMEQFRLQLAATPSHTPSRVALLKSLVATGGWKTAVATADSILARDPSVAEAYPYLAAAKWRRGDFQGALGVFETYFQYAEERERALYADLSLVLDVSEQSKWERLDEEGRRRYWEHYWDKRDPRSGSGVNDRLLEHYIRIAYARIEYGEQVWPWDERGAMFVRYGEPDITMGYGQPFALDLITADWESTDPDRAAQVGDWDFHIKQRELRKELGLWRLPMEESAQYSQARWAREARAQGQWDEIHFDIPPDTVSPRIFDASGEPMTTGSATPEEWVYTDLGLRLTFQDPVNSGRFYVANREVSEAMERRMPAVSEMETNALTFQPMETVVTFRGEGGSTALEYYVGLLPEDFQLFQSEPGAFASVDAEIQLFDPDWRAVTGAGSRVTNLPTTPRIHMMGAPVFLHGLRTRAEPGQYMLSTILIDPRSGQRAMTDEEIQLPDYTGSGLMVSDILLAASIREVPRAPEGLFVRDGLEVLPLPGPVVRREEPFFIYFEVYNLARDRIGATDYEIAYSVAETPGAVSLPKTLIRGLRTLIGQEEGRAVLTSFVEGSGISRDLSTHLEVDVSRLEPGDYTLTLAVTDRLSGSIASTVVGFRLF